METRDENGKWLPGISSPNPSGRPSISAEEHTMRENFKKAFAMLGNKPMSEIMEIASDKSQPAPYAIAAKALEWAFKKGAPGMFKEIFDRTIGPVTQSLNIEGDMQLSTRSYVNTEELTMNQLDQLYNKEKTRLLLKSSSPESDH